MKIVDVPKPDLVINIFKQCESGNIKQAIVEINSLLNDGYNAYDIVQIMSRVIGDNTQLEDEIKFDLLKEVSYFKTKVLDGLDSKASIYGFLGNITEPFLNKKLKGIK